MERIVYRKTLDVHKNGIQFTLQGFETADNMARKIEISLMASGDTIDLPLEQLEAVMYVTTPNAIEPSINACTIKDNTIIYDVLPIVEEGITEMQLKLIETRLDGANGVLAAPKFAIEVTKSNTDDESVIQTPTYTALENAIATAKGVYDSRLIRIELDSDCMFRAVFADGTAYESDVLKKTVLEGEALLSQSYARGGTGLREDENTDNSMYYSNVSRSAAEDARIVREDSAEIYEEVKKHGVYTAFSVDFETGEMKYISPLYKFSIDEESGELDVIGETYTPDETINKIVTEWIESRTSEIAELVEKVNTLKTENDEAHESFSNGIASLGNEIDKTNSALAQTDKNVEDYAKNAEKYTNNVSENLTNFATWTEEKFDSVETELSLRKKQLWSGSWSGNESIVVNGSKNYMLFKIGLDGQGTSILAIRHGDYIRGIGGYSSATPNVITFHFAAKVEEEVWYSKVCNSGNPFEDGTLTNLIVTSIVGII